jgi:hypothetical protein
LVMPYIKSRLNPGTDPKRASTLFLLKAIDLNLIRTGIIIAIFTLLFSFQKKESSLYQTQIPVLDNLLNL